MILNFEGYPINEYIKYNNTLKPTTMNKKQNSGNPPALTIF